MIFAIFIIYADIPENEYIKYFAPEFSLKIPNGHIVCCFCYFCPIMQFLTLNRIFLVEFVARFVGSYDIMALHGQIHKVCILSLNFAIKVLSKSFLIVIVFFLWGRC